MPTLSTDDCELSYTVCGSGPSLVFLHGAWLDGDLWTPQVDRYADRYRTIVVDLPGHGGSDRVDAPSVGGYADAVGELIAAETDVPPVLCGLSLGGLVAQSLAAGDRDVAGLVLADTMSSVPPVPLTDLQKHVFFPRVAAHASVRTIGPAAYFRLLLSGVEAGECRRWLAVSSDAREYALDRVGRFDAGGFLDVFDALYDFDPVDLGDVSVPALVLYGDHEASVVKKQNRDLADALSADRRVVPDAGHLSNRDNPVAFGAALDSFLDERTAAGPASD